MLSKSPETLQAGEPDLLWNELVEEARSDPLGGRLMDPSSAETRRLFDDWWVPNVFVCQLRPDPCSEHCGIKSNRCGDAYWRSHSQLVADMMCGLAEERGESDTMTELWRQTGLLHDLDYIRAPHNAPGRHRNSSHPIPLVLSLRRMALHPIISLAILEHSPHLHMGPSSPLSAALIACDEAATLAAFGQIRGEIDGVPKAVTDLVAETNSGPPAEGLHRPGMRERMLKNFLQLNGPTESFLVAIP